jgi:hypothetical protein
MNESVPLFHSFAEFWPFYLGEHRKYATRLTHVIGTSIAALVLVAALIFGHPLWLIAVPFIGYGFAWVSHAFIERNRPATFTYPLWSLYGDLRMLGLWLTGRLAAEVARSQPKD